MTKWRTTYDQAVARGTLLDAVAEFKPLGGDSIRGGGHQPLTLICWNLCTPRPRP
jgi:hypothetical protein